MLNLKYIGPHVFDIVSCIQPHSPFCHWQKLNTCQIIAMEMAEKDKN